MKLKRAWLILRLKGTNKILLLKRSKKSRNSKQWDFIGGSQKGKRVRPRKLIRKESHEEIGFTPLYLINKLIVVEKFSIYHYYMSTINRKQLRRIELSHEHSHIKLVDLHKLKQQKNLHHSVLIYLKHYL